MKIPIKLLLPIAMGGIYVLASCPVYAQGWKLTSAPIANWQCVASSADGNNLAAAVSGGGIFTSTNSGVNWTSNTVPVGAWSAIACSTNGAKLAAVINGGGIFTSGDSGKTWRKTGALTKSWTCVAASGDGKTLVGGATGAAIYKSSNFGTNWTSLSAPITNWNSIAISSDGSKLVAACSGVIVSPFGNSASGSVYTSTNSGTTGRRSSGLPDQAWTLVAASADGKRLAASGLVVFLGSVYPSDIHISTNSGATWNSSGFGIFTDEHVTSIVSSADGNVLMVAKDLFPGSIFGTGGFIFGSIDGGGTWSSFGSPNLQWASMACSVGCGKLVALVNGGGVYTWQYQPVVSLTSSRNNVLISWLASSLASGFVLEENSSLLSTNWTEVTAPVIDVGTNRTVSLPVPSKNLFYRLKK